ncbi:hypothetical protein [Bosea sp. (in: a-proteobacteria)]|uniref:hypothetical protein n=1 Tax=Bosea sp. (in: a-proteobacteria) TaxID=1871050 RepID=UPI003B3A8F02
MPIDWAVLARQLALILVPLILSWIRLPPELAQMISGPMVEVLAGAILVGGTALVGWVIYLGQRREKPAVKIAETAELPGVKRIVVADPGMAVEVPSLKVTT